MNILFLANDGEGLYKFRRELLQELSLDNNVFTSLPKDNYTEKLIGLGCSFIETRFDRQGTNPIKDLKLIFTYLKLLEDIKPDVVLTYTIKPNVYGGVACQIKHIPYITNITGLGSAVENGGILQKISLTLYKIGLRKAKKVFFQNETNKKFMLEKGVINGPTDLVPGSGVNLKEYKLLDYPKGDTIDFCYIGRIMTEKGFKQYIEAAEDIKERHSETRFHVCGLFEDDYKDEVDRLVKKNVLIYHGSVSNMAKDIYPIIECVVHPSYYAEGMSNVLLEAGACGRSVITTNRAGCKETIDDGINGFIVNQKDTKDLIDKIEKFVSLPRSERMKMGLNGRKKIEKEFDRDIVINKYIEEINSIKQ